MNLEDNATIISHILKTDAILKKIDNILVLNVLKCNGILSN
jgi:hypothetical protein